MVRLVLLNELDPLGLTINRTNDSNELRSLTHKINRAFYQEYELPRIIARKLESNNKYNNIIQCKDFPYEYL